MDIKDGRISDFLAMQHTLAEEKGWIVHRTPEHAPLSLLWSIEEIGEAVAVIKKKGADGIMNNESVRSHFTEELADTFMYLFDVMESYGITAEEFTDAFVRKFEKNLGRNWNENKAMYEKLNTELIIFDMEGTLTHDGAALPWTERLLEVLGKTGVKSAVISDLPTDKVKTILKNAGLESEAFDAVISSLHYGEGFEAAVKETGTSPDKTVVCTASAVGVKIAKRCGMKAVAVKTHFAKDFYIKAGADLVCDDLTELTEFIGLNN